MFLEHFHSFLLRHMELRCQQQQEALSAQLESERHEQQQFKRNLERETREQTELKEKTVMDTNQKLTSLQQHYKLLKSQNGDLAEECTKAKTKQLAEIKVLQDKIKTMQTQHEKDIENLRVFMSKSILTNLIKIHCFTIICSICRPNTIKTIRWRRRTQRSIDCVNKSMFSIYIVHGDRTTLRIPLSKRPKKRTIKISMSKFL